MESVVTVLAFILELATTFFSFIMSSWVTALLPVGLVVVFVLDLVVSSSSGGGDDK